MQFKYESKPMCDGCPRFVLDVATDTLFAHDEVVCRLSTVRCKNRKLCDDIERYITKTLSTKTLSLETSVPPPCPNLFDKGAYDQHDKK